MRPLRGACKGRIVAAGYEGEQAHVRARNCARTRSRRCIAGEPQGHVTAVHQAKVWSGHGKLALVATGKLGDLDLMPGEAGRVVLTRPPKGPPSERGPGIPRITPPADTDISTRGRLAVEPVLTPGVRAGLAHIKTAGKGFTRNESAPQDTRPTPETVAGDQPVTVASSGL